MSIMNSGSLNIGNNIVISLYQSLMELVDHLMLLAAILSNTYSTAMTFCMSDTKQPIVAKLRKVKRYVTKCPLLSPSNQTVIYMVYL